MKGVIARLAGAALLLIVSGPAASCQQSPTSSTDSQWHTFTSAKGFTMDYPSGWTIASQDHTKMVFDYAQDKEHAAGFKQDQVAVLIIDPQGSMIHRNVNVIAQPYPVAISQKTKDDMRAIVTTATKAFGATPTDFTVTDETFAGMPCLVDHYKWNMNGVQLAQMQVLMSTRHASYVVTCSSEASQADEDAAVFGKIVNSMRFTDAPAALPAAFRYGMIVMMVGAFASIIVACIGILVAVVVANRRRRRIG